MGEDARCIRKGTFELVTLSRAPHFKLHDVANEPTFVFGSKLLLPSHHRFETLFHVVVVVLIVM